MESFFNKNKAIDFCFYLLIAVLPFLLILTPLAVALLIIAYIFIGNKIDFVLRLKTNNYVLLITSIYLLNVVGMFFSIKYGITYKRMEVQLLLLVIPILFIALDLNLNQIKMAKYVYVLSCIAFCLVAMATLIYNVIVNFEHRLDYDFVQTSMYHFHYPYDVFCINTAYILLLFNARLKRLKGVITILFFVFIILSGVRMGVVVFGIISMVYILLNFRIFLNLKSFLVLFVFLIMSVVLIKVSRYANDKFFDSLHKIGFKTEDQVSNIGENYHKVRLRQTLWLSSLKTLENSPNFFIGYGPQGSREPLNEIYKEMGNEDIEGLNSHNQYLTTLLNNGFIGLFVLILIFTLGLAQSFKKKSLENFLLVLIMATAFMTESMLERQKGVSIFAIFLTLIFLENRLYRKPLV